VPCDWKTQLVPAIACGGQRIGVVVEAGVERGSQCQRESPINVNVAAEVGFEQRNVTEGREAAFRTVS